ncbi:hypothetical protein HBI68_172660 [Parastagonospora nodorum]|nr:hypothetical protein HBI68_172660 [Parastagonospora nodorum]
MRFFTTRLRIIEIKNYAKRNSTVFITRDYTIIKLIRLKHCCYAVYLLNTEERTTFYAIRLQEYIRTANARRIVRGLENSASASLLVYSNYALQKCSLLTLIGIVLYNTIKEYYNDRTRKTIYFYSYTIENDYYNNDCRTSYSNKEDIEANKREEETRVQLRELSEKIYNILLREFRKANDFTESIIHNNDEQDEFAILAEKYTIDNCIIHALALTKDE